VFTTNISYNFATTSPSFTINLIAINLPIYCGHFAPLLVNFTDLSTITPTSWLWDFGEMNADTPLHAVFKRADGGRTYLAFNARKTPLEVRFSDGKRMTVAPGALGRLSPG
jgi:hypothetical protein